MVGGPSTWQQPPLDVVIETDAPTVGWGAVCQGIRTGGVWSPHTHINVLELTAGMFADQSFLKDHHVHLRMDNTSALTYVKKMGRTRFPRLMKVAC